METTINSMWTSFATSIPQLESMVVGFAYVLGIAFIFHAIGQFHDLADRYTKHSVKGGMFEPMAYLLSGSILLWLPSWLPVFEATIFGTDSPLAYSSAVVSNMPLLQNMSNYAVTETLELVGIVFFVRGVVLMALSSAPGTQHGTRGFIFMVAGVLSVNFPATFSLIQDTIETFVTSSHTLTPIHQDIQSFFN
jgi:hypothetical protein